jgi:hypothetical protein
MDATEEDSGMLLQLDRHRLGAGKGGGLHSGDGHSGQISIPLGQRKADRWRRWSAQPVRRGQ